VSVNDALNLRLFGRYNSFGFFSILLLGALLLPELVKKLLETLVFYIPDHTLGPLLVVLGTRFQDDMHIIQVNLAWFAQQLVPWDINPQLLDEATDHGHRGTKE
jgi:hypothetical protein